MTNLVILVMILLLWIPATLVILHNLISDLYFWQAHGYQMRRVYSSLRWDAIRTHHQRIYYLAKLIAFLLCSTFLLSVLSPLPILGMLIAFSLWFNQSLDLPFSEKLPIRFQAYNLIPLLLAVTALSVIPVTLAIPLIQQAVPNATNFEVAGIFPQTDLSGLIIIPDIYIFLVFSTLLAIVYDLGSPIIMSIAVVVSKPIYAVYSWMLIQRMRSHIDQFTGLVKVVIVGSYGKTTVKEFLWHLLHQRYKLAAPVEDISTLASLDKFILHRLSVHTEVAILDINSLNRHQLQEMFAIIQPQLLVITGVDNSQISAFGSRDQLLDTYQAAIAAMPANGTVILNGEDQALHTLSQQRDYKEIFFYGHEHSSLPHQTQDSLNVNNLYLSDLETKKGKLVGTLHTLTQKVPLDLPLLASGNLASLLAAIAVGVELGNPIGELTSNASELPFAPHALESADGDNSSQLLFDLHGLNIQRFHHALNSAGEYPQQRKILVTAGIKQLGKYKRHHYRHELLEIIRGQFQHVITTDKTLASILRRDNTELTISYLVETGKIIDKIAELTTVPTLIMILGDVDPKIVSYLSIND